MTDIRYSDDASLQRWGASLKTVEAAAAAVARRYAEAEAAAARFNTALGRIQSQGETDLPTSDRTVSEVQAVAQRARGATTADAWRGVASDSGTLPGQYQRDHEADEDRLNAPRRSLDAERRADAGYDGGGAGGAAVSDADLDRQVQDHYAAMDDLRDEQASGLDPTYRPDQDRAAEIRAGDPLA